MKKNHITQNELKEIFDYKNGNLIWKVKRRGTKGIGNIAGYLGKNGYVKLHLQGSYFVAHRLIWIWHYGEIKDNLQIDHIDRNKSNNNIENLRLVTNQENGFNRGAKGYSFVPSKNKYRARIRLNGILKDLGLYDTKQEAHKAYLKAKEKVHSLIDSPDLSIMKIRETKGYCFHKVANKFMAYISINGKTKNLGLFLKEEDARNAHLQAKMQTKILS